MTASARMTMEAARRLLSVAVDCDAETLKSARNKAMMSAHPDHGGSEEALRLVIEAHSILSGESEPGPATEADTGERLEITPSIAMLGGKHQTRLSDGRRIAINLPAGLRNGDKVAAGGATLTVRIKAGGGVFVSGDDLCMQIKASTTLLANGGRVKVKTPAGYCVVWIPKQLGSNRIVRVLGRGLPARGRHQQGALLIKLMPQQAANDAAKPAKPAKQRRA